jgi:hypothetical protein
MSSNKQHLAGPKTPKQEPRLEELTELLLDTKVGHKADAALETLAESVGQRWSPNQTLGEKSGGANTKDASSPTDKRTNAGA